MKHNMKLILEVTYYNFCCILLLTRPTLSSVGKGYIRMSVQGRGPGDHLRLWLPQMGSTKHKKCCMKVFFFEI